MSHPLLLQDFSGHKVYQVKKIPAFRDCLKQEHYIKQINMTF